MTVADPDPGVGKLVADQFVELFPDDFADTLVTVRVHALRITESGGERLLLRPSIAHGRRSSYGSAPVNRTVSYGENVVKMW